MRLRSSLLSLSLAAGAIAAGPAVTPDAEPSCTLVLGAETEETDDDVEACRQDVWFHETGLKADNVDSVQGVAAATWDTTPPGSSVTDGAGSGALATSVLHQNADAHDPREAFVATGSFEGAIDNVVVELYMFRPGLTPSVNTGDPTGAGFKTRHSVEAALIIDGFQVATLSAADVALHPAGDAAERITFAFRDLIDVLAFFPNLEGTHTVEVRARGTGFGSDGHIVVYDTTEVPSGLVFNAPASLLAEVDEANAPA